jgi:hypothetical protein
MIQTNHQWRAVEQPHQPGSLTPLFPKRAGDSDTLTVLRQPAAARQPHTNWGLLSAYRSSNAAEEVASDGQ